MERKPLLQLILAFTAGGVLVGLLVLGSVYEGFLLASHQSPTSQPFQQDAPVDLAEYCRIVWGGNLEIPEGGNAYSPQCVVTEPYRTISVTRACQMRYGRNDIHAVAKDPNNPKSWGCFPD